MSERDEFERFVTDKFFDIEKDHIGYTSWATAFAWKVWQDTRAAARATPQQAMPEGWKLVPVEPTESMRLAPAKDRPGFSRNVAAEIYRSMLAAAPQPSQEPEKAEECSICAVDPMLCSRHKMSSEEFVRRVEFRQKYQD